MPSGRVIFPDNCSQGHQDWRIRPDGRRRCATCRLDWEQRNRQTAKPGRKLPELCGQGHDNWKVGADGKRRCQTCKADYNAQYNVKVRDERECKNCGASDWTTWASSPNRRRCRPCYNAKRRASNGHASRKVGGFGSGRTDGRDTNLPETPTWSQIMRWRGYVA